MTPFVLIDAPSVLGLRPDGVQELPKALRVAGLQEGLKAEYAGRIEPPPYEAERDPETLVLNPSGLRDYARQLAGKVTEVLQQNKFPIVLGGDCSNVIGCMLALRRMGRYGLLFIDGHADFYQAEANPNGEVASMDLAIVSGRGPDILTNIDGLRPLARDEDIVVFGYRDAEEQKEFGSQDVRETAIHALDLEQVRELGVAAAAERSIKRLTRNPLSGIWLHLDADVLNDDIMPAVDYRLPDGLQWGELSVVLKVAMASGRFAGMNIGIFNPRLDADGSIARGFVSSLIAGLRDDAVP
ncbi:MAG: arginase family protein [Bryobacteraceae bacterium]